VFLPQNTVYFPVNHGVFAVPARCFSRRHAAFSPPGARAIAQILPIRIICLKSFALRPIDEVDGQSPH
jgi:hypothetical protein